MTSRSSGISAIPGEIAGATRRRRERLFYTGVAFAIALTVFAGFSRTYFLKSYFGAPPLVPLLQLHGLVFTSWILLFLLQILLVATNRTRIHRRIGIAGVVIAGLMVIVGVATALIRARQNFVLSGDTAPLSFLTIPLGDLLLFSALVGGGFYFRRRADVHKRLMLLATISILPAAVARLPLTILQAGPPAFFALMDIFIVACVLFDLLSLRRVHRVTLIAGLAIIVSQPLRLMIGSTQAWLGVANWLTQWRG